MRTSLALLLSIAVPALAQDVKQLQAENAQLKAALEAKAQEVQRLTQEFESHKTQSDTILSAAAEVQESMEGEKRRLVEEKGRLEARIVELVRKVEVKSAPAGKERTEGELVEYRLDAQEVRVKFSANGLVDVLRFLHDVSGLEIKADEAALEHFAVSLRARDVPLRTAFDLVIQNARNAQGEFIDLVWRREGAVIVVEKAPAPPPAPR